MDDKHPPGRPKPPWRRDDKAPAADPAQATTPLEKSRATRESDRASIQDLVKDLRSSLRNDARNREREAEKDC